MLPPPPVSTHSIPGFSSFPPFPTNEEIWCQPEGGDGDVRMVTGGHFKTTGRANEDGLRDAGTLIRRDTQEEN